MGRFTNSGSAIEIAAGKLKLVVRRRGQSPASSCLRRQTLGTKCLPAAISIAGLCAPAFAQDLSPLLSAPQLPPPKWFASTDPKGRNIDYALLQPGETRRVPLAAGTLVRLWSTSGVVDENRVPEKFSLSLQLGARVVPLWRDNRALQGTLYERAYTLYRNLPLPANAQLVATNGIGKPVKWYYQATVRPGPISARAKPPGKVEHLTFPGDFGMSGMTTSLSGSGIVEEIALIVKPGRKPSQSALNDATLELFWDGAKQPSVNVALRELAARDAKNALITTRTAGWTFANGRFVWKLPMPYQKGFVLRLERGETERGPVDVQISYRSLAKVPPFRLHARQGSAFAKRGQPLRLLSVNGAGAFVGLALDIKPKAGSPTRSFAFLEGNETLVADGQRLEGTGTEDFFNSAWYYPDKPFSQPYGGMTEKVAQPPSVSQYRLMISDAVPFKRSFAFEQEVGSGNKRDDLEYRWVAFWYQSNGTATVANELANANNAAPNAPRDASGGASSDWRFMGALFGVFMAAIAAFFVKRRLRRRSA